VLGQSYLQLQHSKQVWQGTAQESNGNWEVMRYGLLPVHGSELALTVTKQVFKKGNF